jgi:hypothetical protein
LTACYMHVDCYYLCYKILTFMAMNSGSYLFRFIAKKSLHSGMEVVTYYWPCFIEKYPFVLKHIC